MANRITPEQIKQINLAYLSCHTYSGAAKAAGVSPSTAKKYIDPNFQAPDANIVAKVVEPLPMNTINPFVRASEIFEATQLSDAEKSEMPLFWKEILI